MITECTLQDNSGNGIFCIDGSPTITWCTVQNNSGTGIYGDGASPTIAECIVQNNTNTGISCSGSPTITQCIVQNNTNTGISCSGSPTITRCSVQDNDKGIQCGGYSPTINTCIIRGNHSYGIVGVGGSPNIIYNDFFENPVDFAGADFPQGIGELVTTNANGDSCDTYFNIFLDPTQAAPPDTLTLLPGSPCIDAGDPSLPYDPDSTIADMGAYFVVQDSIPPPSADFIANPLIGTVPLDVAFTNLSTGAITSYWWDFGDGRGSSLREPSHPYQEMGTYTVSLTATGPGGDDVETKFDYITVLPRTDPPDANFTATPTSGYAPLEVTFTDLTNGLVDSLKWYFGDGDSSSAPSPMHTYAAPDTYTVRLVAYGPYGVDEEIKVDYIKVREYPDIEAEFSTASRAGVPPFYVSFQDLSLGVIESWLWTFDDGDSSTLQHASHTYDEPGAYTVSLRVQGPNGEDTETKVDYIRVYQAIPTIVSISDIPEDQGGKIQIRWLGSAYDGPLGASIAGYNVWQMYQDYWNLVGSFHATQDSIYSSIAITLRDSTDQDTNWTLFRVSAHGTDPSLIYYSVPDSGYSVDNLAPAVPKGFDGQYDYAPDRLSLWWDANTEHDLAGYRIYRGAGEDFVPVDSLCIASTIDNNISGLDYFPSEPWHFKLCAVDVHGNVSEYAVLAPLEITIPTLVTSYHSAWTGNCVEVRWVLSEADPDVDFRVLRKVGPNADFVDFVCDIIQEENRFSFLDKSASHGKICTYRVYAVKNGSETVAFETEISIPRLALTLYQNYPNPFNPETTISFTLPERTRVTLSVYNLEGRLVKTLVDQPLSEGLKEFTWNGVDSKGSPVSSGIYLYRLKTGSKVLTKKMLLLK